MKAATVPLLAAPSNGDRCAAGKQGGRKLRFGRVVHQEGMYSTVVFEDKPFSRFVKRTADLWKVAEKEEVKSGH